MDERQIPGIWPNGIESPADRPIRDINPEISPDGVDGGIDRVEGDGQDKVAPILNDSLIPYFGSIENYERLRRMYPNGIPASAIATGC